MCGKVPVVMPFLVRVLLLAGLALALVPAGTAHAQGALGRFVTICEYSHTLPDDPIVAPGVKGGSHLHDFFGSPSTNFRSTTSSLQRTRRTTCEIPENRSAYWVPSLLVDGKEVRPTALRAYYTAAGKAPRSVQPIPRGLRMVAGDPKATSAQKTSITRWFCYTDQLSSFLNTVPGPYCPRGPANLVLIVFFPDCWDGRNADSADHKSHMAYTRSNALGTERVCPSSHPVPIPRLGIRIVYPNEGGPDAVLSSGGKHSAHADFMDGWETAAHVALVNRCIRGGINCSSAFSNSVAGGDNDEGGAQRRTRSRRAKAILPQLRATQRKLHCLLN